MNLGMCFRVLKRKNILSESLVKDLNLEDSFSV